MRLLLLGGTTEASALARRLAGRADIAATLSLAGRTARPPPSPLPTRIGGFGGVAGLARYLDRTTHRRRDRRHASVRRADVGQRRRRLRARRGVPLAVLTRPPGAPRAGDAGARSATPPRPRRRSGETPRRVFLTVGRLQRRRLRRRAAAPLRAALHRRARTICRPPPNACSRGRRSRYDDERRADAQPRASTSSSARTAAATATRAKLDAARELGLPVVMIRRPAPPRATVL